MSLQQLETQLQFEGYVMKRDTASQDITDYDNIS